MTLRNAARLLILALPLLVSRAPAAGQQDRRAAVVNVRHHVHPEFARIVIDLEKLREYTHGQVQEKGLIFVDILQARVGASLKLPRAKVGTEYLKSYALAAKSQSTVRLTAEVDPVKVKSYRVYHLQDPFRIVIDIYQKGTAAAEAAPPAGTGAAGGPAQPLPSGYSMARQLGLGVGTIVLDPGHGGSQPGCIGKSGLQEKTLTLDLALALQKKLAADGYTVLLTRTADATMSLEARTAFANQKKADLYVSIHVNAQRNRDRRGVETFYLNFSPDPDVIATAAMENASSSRGVGQMAEIIKRIVQNTKVEESRALAAMIQRNLVKSVSRQQPGVRDIGVKGGPFWVLIGGQMPSVLVEVAHLSNPLEEKLLQTEAYRALIVEGLYNGIMEYIKSLGKG